MKWFALIQMLMRLLGLLNGGAIQSQQDAEVMQLVSQLEAQGVSKECIKRAVTRLLREAADSLEAWDMSGPFDIFGLLPRLAPVATEFVSCQFGITNQAEAEAISNACLLKAIMAFLADRDNPIAALLAFFACQFGQNGSTPPGGGGGGQSDFRTFPVPVC